MSLLLGGDKIGSAWVEIKADDAHFRRALDDAHGGLSAFSAAAPKLLKAVGVAFGGVTAAAADTAAAVSTVSARGIKDYIRSGQEMTNVSTMQASRKGLSEIFTQPFLQKAQFCRNSVSGGLDETANCTNLHEASLWKRLERDFYSQALKKLEQRGNMGASAPVRFFSKSLDSKEREKLHKLKELVIIGEISGSLPGAVSAAEKTARISEDIFKHDDVGRVRQQELMEVKTTSQAFGKGLSEIFAQAFFQKACPWLWENTSYQYSDPQRRGTGCAPASASECFRGIGDFPHEVFQSMDAYLSRIAESTQCIAEKQPIVIQPGIMISRDSDMRWLANELKPYLQ